MAKRNTIGANPLDAVVPLQRQETIAPAPASAQEPPALSKQRLTVHLPVELIERVKNAVYWTPGLTLAALAEKALEKTVNSIEDDRGESFPQREAELRGGRPIK